MRYYNIVFIDFAFKIIKKYVFIKLIKFHNRNFK